MADLPLGRADYSRNVPKEARIQTRNRFFEANPVLTDSGTALIARPGLDRYAYVGSGPIRALFSQPGDFEEALFTISYDEWYRVDLSGINTLLKGGINLSGQPRMAATGPIGDGAQATPEYLYMADGKVLYLYVENGYASDALTGTPANGDKVVAGDYTYEFTNGDVDTGSPDGSAANPFLVALGAVTLDSLTNLGNAFNVLGNPGTDYSTATLANADLQMQTVADDTVSVRAVSVGSTGNGVAVSTTGAALAWATATLQGGGTPQVSQVQLPSDYGALAVAYIAGYVIVIPVQGGDINGRFYWIEPGETTIDPLDFATAERSPDPVYDVIVFGDQFWLPGASTTEVWYPTGNIDAPMQRLQGVTFDRGTWAGTALQVKESMVIVDSDGGVFQISGGLVRISNPSIEERIRKAILYQASKTLPV